MNFQPGCILKLFIGSNRVGEMPFPFSLLLAVAVILLLFLVTRIPRGDERRRGDRRPRLGPELLGLALLFFLLLAALWLLNR